MLYSIVHILIDIALQQKVLAGFGWVGWMGGYRLLVDPEDVEECHVCIQYFVEGGFVVVHGRAGRVCP